MEKILSYYTQDVNNFCTTYLAAAAGRRCTSVTREAAKKEKKRYEPRRKIFSKEVSWGS